MVVNYIQLMMKHLQEQFLQLLSGIGLVGIIYPIHIELLKMILQKNTFFITTDGSTRAYFKIVYATENDTFPIVSEAIRIGVSGGAIIAYNYILTSIANMNDYKKELYAILDSTDLKTIQLLSFINKYMRDINVTN